MTKRGKYFVPPPKNGSDIKELFKYLMSVGAGLPTDETGLPVGSWTPELLASTISQFESNKMGVDLRTVQHWFQDNDKGISADNIHWLARIFGCDNPEAITAWRAELNAANRRLAAKRRETRSAQKRGANHSDVASKDGDRDAIANTGNRDKRVEPANIPGLAGRTEAMFSSRSSLGLPAVVFAAATALGLMSFSLNIHSILFELPSGTTKQVGFLWAPNWTVVFLVLLPIYFAVLINLLKQWKEEWRTDLVTKLRSKSPRTRWASRVTTMSYVYWAVFVVTVLIASAFNWVETHLIPLLTGNVGNWPVDWGRIAIFQPDLVSLPNAIVFSGLVFLLNAFGSYLFFAGLIVLYTLTDDFVDFSTNLAHDGAADQRQHLARIGEELIVGVFRCCSLGLMITILMKLQASYLLSDSRDIVHWLAADLRAPFRSSVPQYNGYGFHQNVPGFYYSFFCLLVIFAVFVICTARIRKAVKNLGELNGENAERLSLMAMYGILLLLTVTYMLIGMFPGFTIIVIAALVLAACFLTRPTLGRLNATKTRELDA
ncbi:RcgA family putative transporter [Ruegeria sp. MALMAid1280]|uniref:RcgA family putative transporter n=1 Tax=Ruegeria sp. MALMAid1280 TaxID=3411634 RepID=UPI003BA13010